MGFFSSRRTDDERFIVRDQNASKPVVGIIRSRFYGKAKAHPIRPQPAPPEHTATTHIAPESVGDTPVPGRSAPRTSHTATRSPSLPNVRTQPASIYPSPSTPAPTPAPAPKLNTRASTNAVTSMLAQRLTELATANAEGLLDDDEYRLLRQNLFERMAVGSDVPQETPVVPTAGPSRINTHVRDTSYGRTTPSVTDDSVRSPSFSSQRSVSSTVSGIIRRATGRKSSSYRDADSASQYSVSSVGVRRFFTRKPSNVSIRTDDLNSDVMSISSVNPQSAPQTPSRTNPHTPGTLSRSTTRSAKRLANAPPPSSFPSSATPRTPRTNVLDDLLDDAHLKTSKDIRTEIDVIEAEGRRLLDAFNGLELSTLTRQARAKAPRTPGSAASSAGFVWPPPTSHDLAGRDNSDSLSFKSTTSNGTSLSAHRSPTRTRPLPSSLLVSKPISLGRKSSLSSVSSRGRSNPGSGPSAPPLLTSLGVIGSSSSLNLPARSTSHLPLAPVAERESMDGIGAGRHSRMATSPGRRAAAGASEEEDAAFVALESEMADIRRRRAEVMSRYDERLDYLRAKLKGAELHEKLLRK
ncbi:hypothetical protein OF83DRAFT_1150585 [Amylostereum chailletii]|nr:hypothetical protein OF83DRAFT_1150585 [Amylostereum chailletii]